jgi:HSP20 family protein
VLSPFEQLRRLQEEMNRMFAAPFGEGAEGGELFQTRAPALDLYEGKDNIVARLELPGVSKEAIEVSVHEGVLSVSGERQPTEVAGSLAQHRSERFAGRFNRAVSLPKPVKADEVTANYRDGILTVTLPKTEAAKPRQVAVSVG